MFNFYYTSGVIPTHASSLKQDTHLSQRLNEEDRYVGEAEAEGYVLVKLTYAAPDSLRQKERSYTESSTSDDGKFVGTCFSSP